APLTSPPGKAQTRESCARADVYPSHLIAAHDAGLIQIGDPDLADAFVGGLVAGPQPGPGWEVAWFTGLERARRSFGRFAAFAGLELPCGRTVFSEVAAVVRLGLRLTGLTGIINLPAGPAERAPREPTLFPPAEDESTNDEAVRRALDFLS